MKKFLSDVLIDCNLTVSGSSSLGAATGVTVDASDNSNKIATTAWVKSLGFSTANTTYLLDVPANTTNFRLIGSDSSTDTITLSAAGASSITRVSASELRITSSDTIDYISGVSFASNTITFTGTGNAFSGTIDLSVYLTQAEGDSRYLQSYSETDTLDTVTSRDGVTTNTIGVGTINVIGTTAGQELLTVDGTFGRLFTVTDDLSESLFSVNTVAGLPALEVFADNSIKLGAFASPITIDSSSNINIPGVITASGYNDANWNTAYNDRIVSAAVSGTSTKTLTLTQGDGGTVTASWTDIEGDQADGYVSTVALNGNSLDFTGTGSGFTGSVDLSTITSTFDLTEVETVYSSVRNVSGGLIQKGTPLAVVPGQTSGNVSDVVPAEADNPERMPAVFIANEDIANELEGQVVVFGEITGIDTSLFDSGTTVYVAPGGGWTATKPTGANLIQNLGIITKSHPSNGSGVVMGAGRSNDVPNIANGYAWVGNAQGVATPTQLGSNAFTSYTDHSTEGYITSVVGDGSKISTSTDLDTGVVTVNPIMNSVIAETGTALVTSGTIWNYINDSILDIAPIQSVGGDGSAISTVTDVDTGQVTVTGIFNNQPAEGSTALVNSGGIWSYIDSLTETDTLQSVTDRGATSDNLVTLTKNAEQLRFNSADANGSFASFKKNGTNIGFIGSGYHLWSSPNNSSDNIGFRGENQIDFGIGASVKMTLDSSGNVGIGTTSPASKLDIILNSTGGLKVDTNSDGGATITTYQGSTNSNVRQIEFNAQNFQIKTGVPQGTSTTDALFIDSSQNVGIGTTSPNSTLHVSSSSPIITISNSDTSIVDEQVIGQIDFKSLDGSTNMTNVFGSIRTEAEGTLDNGVNDGGKMVFSTFKQSTTLVDQMVIDRDGNVGIGTTSPSAKLHVAGNGEFYSGIGASDDIRTGLAHYDTSTQAAGVGGQLVLGYQYITNGAYTEGAIIKMYKANGTSGDYSSGLKFQVRESGVALSTKMTLNPSGNLGIGTTSPNSKLHVSNGFIRVDASANAQGVEIYGRSSDNIGELNFRTNSGVFLGRIDGRNDGLGVWSSSGLPINFKPGNTGTKVTFQNNGNVGIGTTSPSTKLHVFGNDANLRLTESDWKNGSGQQGGPYLEFALGGNTSEQSFVHARIRSVDRYTAGGAFHGALSFFTSSAGSLGERMRIEYNGNIGVGTTTPSAKLDVVGDVKITGSHTVTTTANSFAGDPAGVQIEVINVEDNFGAFLDYVIHDGGRDSQRAGTLTVTWNLAEIRFNETATMDIGDTSGATLTAVHTGANAEIYFTSPDPTWEIKYTLRKL